MSTLDVLVNDFDSVIQYSDRTAFTTPDPSKKDQSQAALAAGYSKGTYHLTSVSGQSWSLNFTGTDVSIFGSSGPDYGTFDVLLDGEKTSQSAWATELTNSTRLWAKSNLTSGSIHTLTATNGNASMLFDHVGITLDIAASGSEFRNATIEEDNPVVTYTGEWGHNKSPLFSGGGSTYTNGEGATATFEFEGSAVFFYGDTNANHGLYSVTLDDHTPAIFQSATGCGLPYQTKGLCELTDPNLLYYAAYLPKGSHKVVFSNIAGPNGTYFDLDRIVTYSPSEYFVAQAPASSASSVSNAPRSTPTDTGTGAAHNTHAHSIFLLLVISLSWLFS
ncbi:hypothetical protein EXIGLDRAFT_774481 [Exidia glandulosa HHB12029]|uniref:Uncharacterized protein n=1 Tax=Exidia glandulosa HHB12029 TaxID=1314781 RepID=A0A165ZXK8_EXIGL|nr:hypothetical protein EXIGLDRAFT_774481 [Exidia glandulosa HHB12029]